MDKRTTFRRRTFISGLISFNQRQSTMNCVVRNLSKTGALLRLDGPLTLPTMFQMTLPERGRNYLVKVVWASPHAMGVTFVAGAHAS